MPEPESELACHCRVGVASVVVEAFAGEVRLKAAGGVVSTVNEKVLSDWVVFPATSTALTYHW